MSKSKDRAASCTSKFFSDQGAGRNGFAKRNYSTHPRVSSASTQLKWEVKAKKFLLGLLALTSLLVLSARVTLYVSLFRSARHDVATQLAQSESRLLIKLTEPYVGSTGGVEKMKVMEMESSTGQNNRDHAADQLVVETDVAVEMESTDQNTRLDHDVQLVQAVETETLESYKLVDSADAIAFLDELTLNLTGTGSRISHILPQLSVQNPISEASKLELFPGFLCRDPKELRSTASLSSSRVAPAASSAGRVLELPRTGGGSWVCLHDLIVTVLVVGLLCACR